MHFPSAIHPGIKTTTCLLSVGRLEMSPGMRAGHRASSASGLLVSILGGALPSMLATCSFARTMNPTPEGRESHPSQPFPQARYVQSGGEQPGRSEKKKKKKTIRYRFLFFKSSQRPPHTTSRTSGNWLFGKSPQQGPFTGTLLEDSLITEPKCLSREGTCELML